MQIHNCEQGTEEWKQCRVGRMTASEAQAIGNNGKGLETYILELMAEKYSSAQEVSYSNADIERGKELEEQAADIYELQNGVVISKVGFVSIDEYTGCSPDRFVGEDGLLEIKCHNDTKHFNIILNGLKGFDSKYIWQAQMQLLITRRKWCDLCSYNPNFKDSLAIVRITPDKEMHEKLLKGFELGKTKIKEIEEKMK